ncbi:hypothetical protein [Nakamurella lactea]|uniref:hypothetical protein n=1 Tax=Nakamurella lactea TaxID=459515 RepID=UPI00040876E9|nr:hypothetical protein [Nakamurella lactea]
MTQPPLPPPSSGFGAGQFAPGPFPAGQFAPGQFAPGQFPAGQFPAGQFPAGQFPPGPVPPGQFPPGAPGRPAAPINRFGAVVLLARIAAVVLVPLGLSIPFDSSSGWVTQPAWSAFAMLAAVTQLLPAFGGGLGWSVQRGWLVSAVGTGALLLFWLLIVLPGIGSNEGFCLTLAAAVAAAGCVLAPGRRW